MILVHHDDDCIHLYETLESVVASTEALDAIECLRSVFDDSGQRYIIEWIEPNRKHWIVASNGIYRLVPSGPPTPKTLLELLQSVSQIFPDIDSEPMRAVIQKLTQASREPSNQPLE